MSCQESEESDGEMCGGQERSSWPGDVHARLLKWMTVRAEMRFSRRPQTVMNACATGREMRFDCTSSLRLTDRGSFCDGAFRHAQHAF